MVVYWLLGVIAFLALWVVYSFWYGKRINETLYKNNLALSEQVIKQYVGMLEYERDRNARLTILLSQCLGAKFDLE